MLYLLMVIVSILVIGVICLVVLVKVETMTPNDKYIQSKIIFETETEEIK